MLRWIVINVWILVANNILFLKSENSILEIISIIYYDLIEFEKSKHVKYTKKNLLRTDKKWVK